MSIDIAIVLASILFIIIILYKGLLNPVYTFFIVITGLIIAGIISPQEALAGFSNEQVAVIVLLLIFGSILKKSTMIESGFLWLMKKADTPKKFMLRMTVGVGLSSSVFNNTPLVALMMPYVYSWTREHRYAPSKFLIPLSYASILGGCVTLIGTSTNLVVNGMAVELGEKSLDMFDFVYVGGVMLVLGIVYLVYFSSRYLPNNKSASDDLINPTRQFFLETHVQPNSMLIDKTVQDAGLRNMEGLFMVEIIRNEKSISPVTPTEVLQEKDILLFAGDVSSINELTKPDLGLAFPKECDLNLREKNDIVEVVISHNSRLAGQRVKDTEFRSKYDGAILAIHRNGEKLWGQIGKIALKAGDVLLVLSGKEFEKRVAGSPAFYVISKLKKEKEPDFKRIATLLTGMFLAIVLSATGLVSLFTSLLTLLCASLVLKVANPKEMINNVDFPLILIIGMGLALGKAMINTGTDQIIASSLLSITNQLGAVGALAILFIITNLLSSVITTKAAVAVILPVAISIAHTLGVNSEPFILCIAFAGAANFITPIGYQTNLMVYGPGGYSFKDFFKVGLPISVVYFVVCVLILSLQYSFL